MIWWILMFPLVSACLNDQKKTDCSSGQTYSATVRRCISNDELDGVVNNNHYPSPGSDVAVAATEDAGAVSFSVGAGSDQDGDTLSYIITSDAAMGTLTDCMNKTGSTGASDLTCNYTPSANSAGVDTIYYKLYDGKGYSVSVGTITVTITAVDDNPTIFNISAAATMDEDTTLNFYLTADEGGSLDEDADGIDVYVAESATTMMDSGSTVNFYYGATSLGSCAISTWCSLGDSTSSADVNNVRVEIVPDADENGTLTLDFEVRQTSDSTESDGEVAGATFSSRSFTYTAKNDAPKIIEFNTDDSGTYTAGSPADMTVAEETATTFYMHWGEGGGTDEDADGVDFTLTSSNSALFDPTSTGNTLGCDGGGATTASGTGIWDLDAVTGGDCLDANDLDGMAASSDVELTLVPMAGQYGTAVITLQLDDDDGHASGDGAATQSYTFTMTVTEVNDAPEADLSGGLGVGYLTNGVSFSEGSTLDLDFTVDEDSINTSGGNSEDDQHLLVSVSSSDTAVLPYSGIEVFYNSVSLGSPTDNTTQLTLGDGAGNASASGIVFRLTASASGTTSFDYILEDAHSGAGSFTAASTAFSAISSGAILVNVNDVDQPPTLDAIADIDINEGLTENILLTGLTEGLGDPASEKISAEFKVILATDSEYSDGSCGLTTTQQTNYNTALHPSANFSFNFINQTSGGSAGWYAISSATGTFTNIDDGTNYNGGTEFSPANTELSYYLGVTPVGGQTGSVCIKMGLSDDGGAATTFLDYFNITVNAVSAVHGDWKNVKSVGKSVDHDANTISAGYIDLTWNAFTLFGSSATSGYKIFCSLKDDYKYFDFNQPLVSDTLSSSTRQFLSTDSLTYNTYHYNGTGEDPGTTGSLSNPYKCLDENGAFIAGVPLYFIIGAIADNGKVTGSTETKAKIRVIYPPNNMSLVHRWIANREACTKMGMAYDSSNNYRCQFTGPGQSAAGDYYDLDGDLIVDTFEAGCNYATAGSTACSSTGNGCIGTGDPNAAFYDSFASGELYYERSTGKCYVADAGGGTTWTEIGNGGLAANTSGVLNNGGTDLSATATTGYPLNVGHLPPLTNVSQNQAQAYCTHADQAIGIAEGDGNAISLNARLLSRQEFVAASAWDENTYSDTTINTMEEGGSLNSLYYCNSQTSNGLTYVDAEVPASALADTLPGTAVSNIELVRTASTATSLCKSRYGIQDLIGNAAEWGLNFVDCTNWAGGTCEYRSYDPITGSARGAAAAELDFDGMDGPNNGGTDMTSWDYTDKAYSSDNFIFSVGLISVNTYKYSAYAGDSLVIGSAGGITSAQLHGDNINFDTADIDAGDLDFGGALSGGSVMSGGSDAGRYSVKFQRTEDDTGVIHHPTFNTGSGTGNFAGFRCGGVTNF
jgi:hypothetical protein